MTTTSPRKIIIASANADFAESLKKHFERYHFKVVEIVVVLEHLIETLEMLRVEGERVDGIILTSDIGRKNGDKRLELVSDVLLTIRERYSEVNVVVLANESQGHPFLAELVSMGIYNIFIKGGSDFTIPALISTFEKPVAFSEVAKYRNADPKILWNREIRGGQAIQIHLSQTDNANTKAQEEESNDEDNHNPKKKRSFFLFEDGEDEFDGFMPPKVREKVVIKEKTVEIEVPKYLTISPKTIAVISLYPQAGSTFLIDNFVTYLSNSNIPAGVIETASRSPVWIEMLGEEKTPPEWVPWIKQIKENGFVRKGTEWKENNVYYMPFSREPLEGITQEDALKFFYLTKQIPILFVDVSHNFDNPITDVALHQSDEIWLVIAGDPVQINVNAEKVTNIINQIDQNKPTVIIGNKWTKTLDEYLTPEILRERIGYPLVTNIPDVSDVNLSALWQRKRALDTTKGNSLLEKPFRDLAARILPEDVVKGFAPKKSWLKIMSR